VSGVSPAARRWPALAALFAALVLVLYADPLLVRRNWGGRDLIAYNLPMEKSVHDAWGRGRLPVWTPEVSGGRPLAPNPNVGALYPVRVLLSPVPFPQAMRLFPVLHWVAAGLGMLALLSALGRSPAASWIGAVTYAFSGVAVAEAFFPHILPGFALLPWIVWAIGRRSPSWAGWLLPLALLIALDFLAADVFTIVLAIATAGVWLAAEEDGARQRRGAGLVAAAVALGVLAAAPQIVATALWIPLTNRAVLGMKLADSLYFSIHPVRLLELLVPYPFGPAWEMSGKALWGAPLFHGRAMGIFPTLYAGALALLAVPIAWRSPARGARFARWLLAGSLVLAVVPSLVPPSLADVSSPLPLRNPEKLAAVVTLALAVLAAVAVDAWRERPRRLALPLAVGAVLAAAAAVAAAWPDASGRFAVALIGGDSVHAPVAARSLAGALAEAGLCWMVTLVALDLLGGSRRRVAGALAVFLLTLVPIAANRRIARTSLEEEVLAPTAFAHYVARHDPAGQYRTLGESLFRGSSRLEYEQNAGALSESEFARRSWYQHTPVLWGRGTVFNEDFDAGDLSRVESLRKVSGMASGFLDAEAFFGAVALKWGIRFRDQTAAPGYHPIGGDALQIWDEHQHAYPDIRLLERWREVSGSIPALSALPRLGDGEVVVESGSSRDGRARPGTVRVVERTAERLVVDVDAPDATWLFVLRADWPYRAVALDGRAVDAAPAQLAFSAVPIPAGKHRLVWTERLPGLALSAWGPALFGAAILGLVVARRRGARP